MCTNQYLIVHLVMPRVQEMKLKQLLVVEVDPSYHYKLTWIVGD